jgi:DNA repair exonuclease SbcCD ATPase subunit
VKITRRKLRQLIKESWKGFDFDRKEDGPDEYTHHDGTTYRRESTAHGKEGVERWRGGVGSKTYLVYQDHPYASTKDQLAAKIDTYAQRDAELAAQKKEHDEFMQQSNERQARMKKQREFYDELSKDPERLERYVRDNPDEFADVKAAIDQGLFERLIRKEVERRLIGRYNVLRESFDDEDSSEEGLDPMQQEFKYRLHPDLFDVSDITDARSTGVLDRIFAEEFDEFQLNIKIQQLEYEIKKESESMYDVQMEYDQVVPLKQALIDQIKLAIDDLFGLD